ncbi:MAG TPA: glycosyltransferase family 4 protein [Verrucomicrobiae bacterium]|nr:glycosyltransferase family 4 protein [Verrucomicrobiae bacterium]
MNAPARKTLLVFGYLPPPYFGPSVACRTLMRTEFGTHFDIHFIDLTVARDLSGIEKFRWSKICKLSGLFFKEFRLLLGQRFAACLYPVSFNRNAFLKDALLLWMARLFGVPTVLWAHGNNLPDFRAKSPRWLQWVIDWTVKNATAAIVLGERLRFNFQQYLPEGQIYVSPLGIEPTPAASRPTAAVQSPTILFLSNLIREKGLFVLLQAIPDVLNVRPDTRLVFAGAWWNETDRREAEELIQSLKIAASVQFVGVVSGEAKQRILGQADVLVLPTFYYYEAHPNVLLEALQAGLPVVSTRRGSIPEIIEDGVNGLLVEEQNPRDLADKLLQLINDPSLREQMARANREKFVKFYTSERFGERMIHVLELLTATTT